MRNSAVHDWLDQRRDARLTVFAATAAFGAYFCMYAFRKPFTAGEYAGLEFAGFDYKVLLILSQVAGYTLSKFIGIRVIAEMPANQRIVGLLGLIGLAEAALIGFGAVPYPYHGLFLFANGLSLGMIWGIVFSFLEGRRDTEVLGACLSASFIVSSGVVKAVGKHAIDAWAVTEFWMPAVTGLLFLAPLCGFAWMLSQIPNPSEQDKRLRTERAPMDRAARLACLRQLALGVGLLVLVHMVLTAIRDYRDKFAVEILEAVGAGEASYLALSELPIMLLILAPLGATMVIRDHAAALRLLHGILFAGLVVAVTSTVAFQAGLVGGFLWYMLVGLGMYLAYVPFHSILFDRIVAHRGQVGNAGFLIYLADSTGYLSSVAVLLVKNFGAANATPVDFLQRITLVGGVIGGLAVVVSWAYFTAPHRWREVSPAS